MAKNKLRESMFGSHHKYSASSSGMWLNCTKALPTIIAGVEDGKITLDSSNIHSARGTVVHTICEKCLERNLNPSQFLGKTMKAGGFSFIVDDKMVEGVKVFLVFVYETMENCFSPVLLIEQSFDLSKETNADAGGSADVVITDFSGGFIYVYDYKNGMGLVEVTNNTQCKLYAIGAYLSLSKKEQEQIFFVKIGISQPNAYHPDGSCRTQTIPIEELKDWFFNLVVPTIEKTESGKGVFNAGAIQCKWCAVAGYCVENNKQVLTDDFLEIVSEKKTLQPNELTLDEVKNILDNREKITQYLKQVYFYALNAMENSQIIDGYKLVKSLSNRTYKNTEKTENRLKRKLKNENFYKPKEIKTPAQIEKHLKTIEKWKPKKIKSFMETNTGRFETATKLVADSDFGEAALLPLDDDFSEIVAKKKTK